MLSDTFEVPFNDSAVLGHILTRNKIAAVVLEPIQDEAGIVDLEPGYLATVQDLCHKHSALFALDVLRIRSLFSQVVDCRRIVVSS